MGFLILYFCFQDSTSVRIPALLEMRQKLCATDVSLISWLESLTLDQFSLPFEQKTLDLKVVVIESIFSQFIVLGR